MKGSVVSIVKRSVAALAAGLVPAKDRGNARHGDNRAVMIYGQNAGAVARLTVTAIDAADVPEYGRGVYLVIEGDFHADLRDAIAGAAAAGDRDLCIFLNEPAKANLLEQLEHHRTIISLQEAMAAQARARG